ncbi:MAG: GreA/GreB family elongation factor [Crocinitomicaceae bacterium]|nr:GreA/GreB family elongation factor [Crocinitomicaceae bacterium]MBK8926697.1 GreA/GreB family elongation factor [Crocinitomicaceae bacterium]
MKIMEESVLIVSKEELPIIKRLIEKYPATDIIEKRGRQKLYRELKLAELKSNDEMPAEVVRLNSIVSVQTSFGRKDGLKIVLPQESNLQKKKLSVMSSMGTALYGYAEGSKVLWNLPNGEEFIVIERVINDKE